MLLFNILAIAYFALGWYICGESFERTKAAQDLNASLVEELTLTRKELVRVSKAIETILNEEINAVSKL